MRGERGMSDVVETTSDKDGGAQGLEGRMEGRKGSRGGWRGAKRGRKEGAQGGSEGARRAQGAIILLFHRGRTPRWR